MGYKHVLLEVYCGFNYSEDANAKVPLFCKNGVNNPGYHCFEKDCTFKSFTKCPNEFAYIGEFGEVQDESSFVGFGGEMDSIDNNELERKKMIELWERICKRKINEAYDEYMIEKSKCYNSTNF